jgi:hypothetical protein
MQDQLNQSRTASVILLLAGVWVATSPIWISMTGGALTSTIITGIIVALAGLVQFFWRVNVPSWVAGLAAVWLFISSFVFTTSTGAMWNLIISAIVTLIVAYWDGFEMSQVRGYHAHTHGAM